MLKLIKTIPKYISTLNYTTTPSKWDPIYKLPSIQSLSAIAKLKIYAAGLTAITVPVCGVTHTLGLFHPQLLPISATLGKYPQHLFAAPQIVGTYSMYQVWKRYHSGKVHFSHEYNSCRQWSL